MVLQLLSAGSGAAQIYSTRISSAENVGIAPFLYLVSGVLFILALRGLSSPATSRAGNRYGMIGMAIAVLTTIVTHFPMIQTGCLPPNAHDGHFVFCEDVITAAVSYTHLDVYKRQTLLRLQKNNREGVNLMAQVQTDDTPRTNPARDTYEGFIRLIKVATPAILLLVALIIYLLTH